MQHIFFVNICVPFFTATLSIHREHLIKQPVQRPGFFRGKPPILIDDGAVQADKAVYPVITGYSSNLEKISVFSLDTITKPLLHNTHEASQQPLLAGFLQPLPASSQQNKCHRKCQHTQYDSQALEGYLLFQCL